jgi:hypothetical protein
MKVAATTFTNIEYTAAPIRDTFFRNDPGTSRKIPCDVLKISSTLIAIVSHIGTVHVYPLGITCFTTPIVRRKIRWESRVSKLEDKHMPGANCQDCLLRSRSTFYIPVQTLNVRRWCLDSPPATNHVLRDASRDEQKSPYR